MNRAEIRSKSSDLYTNIRYIIGSQVDVRPAIDLIESFAMEIVEECAKKCIRCYGSGVIENAVPPYACPACAPIRAMKGE